MKKILLMILLIIMTGCSSVTSIEERGTIEEKVDTDGSIVKVLTNYRESNGEKFNGKYVVSNGIIKNGKFTGVRKVEGINQDKKIVLEENLRNDKILERKYNDYEDKNKNGETVVINGVEKNGKFTGSKKTINLKRDLLEISTTEEIKNNIVFSKIGNLRREYYHMKIFSPNVLLETVDINWYKERRFGDVREIEAQSMYFDFTEEFMEKAKIPGFRKEIIKEINKKGFTEDIWGAYNGFEEMVIVSFDGRGHLKSPKRIKVKYNVKTDTFIDFDYYFKGKKINTSKMSNTKKKAIYNELCKGELATAKKWLETLNEIAVEKARQAAQARAEFEAFLNGLQQVANEYEAVKAQNEIQQLQQNRLENLQTELIKREMRLKEKQIDNSSNYNSNADKHKAKVEMWNQY